jgi:hypothetical protein
MRRILLALTAAVTVALYVHGAAVAQTKPQVKLESKEATLAADGSVVDSLTARVKCGPLGPEEGGTLVIGVTQPGEFGDIVAEDFVPLSCTGGWETVTARNLFARGGPLQPGPASAFALVLVGATQEDRDTRTIELVQ